MERSRGNVVGKVVVVAADKLAPVVFEVALLEFIVGLTDGFEERVGDTGEGSGAFGIDAALGEELKEPREGVGEGGGGNEVAGDGFNEIRSDGIGFLEVA
jgi:hypothetical protein